MQPGTKLPTWLKRKPYVQRALQDEELRDNLRSAFDTARDVYDELIGKRGVTGVATKVASDKEIQDQLRSAIDDLRSAANRIQGSEGHKAATAHCSWPGSRWGSSSTR